jgi:hypothetical protein
MKGCSELPERENPGSRKPNSSQKANPTTPDESAAYGNLNPIKYI